MSWERGREALAQDVVKQSSSGVPRGAGRAWAAKDAARRGEGPRVRLPGSGGQVGAVTCGRGLGAELRAEGEGARALPVMGSEVLGTERGTRPDTRPLSTAGSSNSSSSGKGEAEEGPGPGRGPTAEASIFGSAWPPGGAHPAASTYGRGVAGLGPARFLSAGLGLRRAGETQLGSALSIVNQWPC